MTWSICFYQYSRCPQLALGAKYIDTVIKVLLLIIIIIITDHFAKHFIPNILLI